MTDIDQLYITQSLEPIVQDLILCLPKKLSVDWLENHRFERMSRYGALYHICVVPYGLALQTINELDIKSILLAKEKSVFAVRANKQGIITEKSYEGQYFTIALKLNQAKTRVLIHIYTVYEDKDCCTII